MAIVINPAQASVPAQITAELSGTAGIASFPAPAAAADAVSIAEVIRWASERMLTRQFNPFGTVRYVDVTSGSDSNDGLSANKADATLAAAITASAAGDTIVLAPGTYPVDVSAASVAAKANQTWIAGMPSNGSTPNVIIVADADDSANVPVSIDVDGCVFKDIEFKLITGGSNALNCVSAAQTTAVRGLTFEDCLFNANGVDIGGSCLNFNDATNAVTGLVVRRCRFTGGTATTNIWLYIEVGVGGIPSALIEDNIFELQSNDGDCGGIDFLDPTAAVKCYGMTIRNNDFIGPSDGGGDAVGIKFATAMTEDEIVGMIRTNYFSNCTVAVTIDEVNNSLVRNYEGDNATGGSIVNPGT